MMSIALSSYNIVKDFSSNGNLLRVLNGASLNIFFGELTMLIGPSGCGKTTLLSILTGILRPTQGKVIINNIDLDTLTDKQNVIFRRTHLGLVFQQFNLLSHLTVAENVALPLLASGIVFNDAVVKAKITLSRFGMSSHANKKPNQLSGGQQQRVAFARALVHDPKVIFCDEPTSALDAQSGYQVMEALQEIAVKPDCAVIVVTHDNRIYSFADRIIHMNDGIIVKEELVEKGNEN
ncbi:ATP-binding cassette domain-containing protein [Candidatus Berkiella aquae]|uniref:ABC transporter ATP-binding protein n=2 Tax=Candidatus Berkiella aquae TaxID=295108 RepID=A0AAE3HYV2_9GAMM|nr:ABC transporter ATP-binding protein [Candidatus Berkiella aquae]MCS5712221.1 ABC transporter ATP-binding protein [Candidatus Berkiella aquae]